MRQNGRQRAERGGAIIPARGASRGQRHGGAALPALLAGALALAAVGAPLPAKAAESPEAPGEGPDGPTRWQPSLSASGESVWTLSYGFGDPAALVGRPGISPEQLGFEQQLRLKLSGQAAPGVTVSADLDNVRSENLQLIGVDVRWERVQAHLGDIRLRSESRYAASQAALKGLSLTADLGSWRLSALVGRAQGIPATKTFTGRASEETVRFVERLPGGEAPYAPTRETYGLVASVRGVEGLPLRVPHDRDFTKVWLRPYDAPVGHEGGPPWPPGECLPPTVPTERSLWRLLEDYQLGALYFDLDTSGTGVLRPWNPGKPGAGEPARAFFPLSPGQVVGVNTPEVPTGTPGRAYVLFTLESLDLLRAHLEELIRRFNEQNGLTGEQRLRYPWVRGSATEREFLTLLSAYYSVQAGSGSHPEAAGFSAASDEVALAAVGTCRVFREQLGSAGGTGPSGSGPAGAGSDSTGRDTPFYLLGQSGLEPDSVTVQARHRATGSLRDAAELGLAWDLFPEAGVLRVRFGGGGLPGLLGQFEGLVVRYRFAGSEGVYALGTSVAAGSERVFLNGQRQQRDVDYTIDYESGLLVLLKPVGPTDELRVDFEYFRGGLGAAAEYHRNTFGLGAQWNPPGGPWRLSAELFFEGDEPRPLVEPERARTMPNAHTVAAFSLAYAAASGTSGRAAGEGPFAELDVAYSHDVFPFDDNRRAHQPNRIHAVGGGLHPASDGGGGQGSLVLVGHRGGLTVGFSPAPSPGGEAGDPGVWRWTTLTTAAGLSGLTVFDVAAAWPGESSDGAVGTGAPAQRPPTAWLVATESGLTVVVNRLPPRARSDALPFDYAENWVRRYTTDGLPANAVRAVLFVGLKTRPPGAGAPGTEPEATVWVGTSKGLAWAPAGPLAHPPEVMGLPDLLRAWHTVQLPGDVPAEVEVRDLALAPFECGPSGCSRADVIAATLAGLVRVPVGTAAGGGETRGEPPAAQPPTASPSRLDGPPGLSRVDAVAALAVSGSGGRVRLFAGGPEGLWVRELDPPPAAGQGGLAQAADRSAGRTFASDTDGGWREIRDERGGPLGPVHRLRALQVGGAAAGGLGEWFLWVASGPGVAVVEQADRAAGPALSAKRVRLAEGGNSPAGPPGLSATALGVAPRPGGSGLEVWAGGTRGPGVGGSGSGGLLLAKTDAAGSGDLQPVAPGEEPTHPGLSADDPARFMDVPAAEHTRTGLAGRLAAGYGWGDGGIQVAIERVEPGFLPINAIQRLDVQRWSASLRHRLTPALQLAIEHGDETTQAAGPRARRVADQLTAEWTLPLPAPISWALPPALRARVAHERLTAEGAGIREVQATLTRALTVQQQLLQGRVGLESGYENVLHEDLAVPSRSFEAHNLLAELRFTPLEGIQATLRYRRPLKLVGGSGSAGGASGTGGAGSAGSAGGAGGPASTAPSGSGPRIEGSQNLDLSAAARRRLGQVDAALELGEQRADRLSTDGPAPERLARRASLSLSLASLSAGTWTLTPATGLRWSYTESMRSQDQRTGAEASLRGRWEGAAIEVALSLGREFADATLPAPRRSTRDTVRMSAAAGGWPLVRPELTLEQSQERAEALLGSDRREARTTAESVLLKAVWRGPSHWPMETRLTGRRSHGPSEGEGSRELQIAHQVGFEPAGPWSLSAAAVAGAGERLPATGPGVPFWRAELSGSLSYRFSPVWQGGLQLGWVTASPTGTPWLPGSPQAGAAAGRPAVQGGWIRVQVRARL